MTIPFDQPFPTREEQYALAVQARAGNDDAYRALVTCHLPLVVRIARRYPDFLPYEDRFQSGAAGLAVAVKKFDPDLGHQLASYAAPAIHNSIRDAIRDARGIKLDPAKWVRIKRASDRIWFEESREPSPEDLAAETGYSVEEVEHQIYSRNAGLMLKEASEPAAVNVEDLPAPAEERPDEQEKKRDALAQTQACLSILPEAERRAVLLFYGCFGEEKRPLAEIAALLGVTLSQATQLKNQGHERLKRLLKVK